MRCCTSILLLTAALPAQVYVVGPSGSFSDIPQAVASVPDGATLRVQGGKYTPFSVTGKGLEIVAEGRVTWTGPGTIQLGATNPTQLIMLRGFELPDHGLQIKQAKGAVVLEGCTVGILRYATDDVLIEGSDNVQIHECDLSGRSIFTPAPAPPGAIIKATQSVVQVSRSIIVGLDGEMSSLAPETGGTGISLSNSRCVVIASIVRGGNGGRGCKSLAACSTDGGTGGTGVSATKSTLVILDSPIAGGSGGARGCFFQKCNCPGSGGLGIDATDTSVVLFGYAPSGGLAGGTTCKVGPGAPIVLKDKSTIRRGAMAAVAGATVEGTQARNQTLNLSLYGQPGATAWMIVSNSPAIVPLDPVIYGSILAVPQVILGAFTVPASTKLQVPWKVPASFPLGAPHFGQFVVFDTFGLWTSNTFPLLVVR